MKLKVTTFAAGMDRLGSTNNIVVLAKLLKLLVGAWGFETC